MSSEVRRPVSDGRPVCSDLMQAFEKSMLEAIGEWPPGSDPPGQRSEVIERSCVQCPHVLLETSDVSYTFLYFLSLNTEQLPLEGLVQAYAMFINTFLFFPFKCLLHIEHHLALNKFNLIILIFLANYSHT